jgi:hypothetical protein
MGETEPPDLSFDVSSNGSSRRGKTTSVAKAKAKGLKPGDKVGQFGTFEGDRGVYDSRNELNDLTGKEWVQFTRSWTIHNPPSRTSKEVLHPAKFPETLRPNARLSLSGSPWQSECYLGLLYAEWKATAESLEGRRLRRGRFTFAVRSLKICRSGLVTR